MPARGIRAGRARHCVIIGGVIDWGLAEKTARAIAGNPPRPPVRGDLIGLTDRSEELVGAYTGLKPATPLPPPELVSRPQWVTANLTTMRALLDPLTLDAGRDLGALAGPVRAATGAAIGVQVGAIVGYLGQRVLGQYDLVLLDAEAPPRLLFVAPNLENASAQLAADPHDLLTWVALHEVTHALQFSGVPWLRPHLATLLHEVTSQLRMPEDVSLKLPSMADLRGAVDTLREGDLLGLVASDEQRHLIDRIQATMAVVEGHAEHVMDAVGADLLPALPELRAALDRRRETQSLLTRILNRLLGLDMKLRQYQLGKGFCDAAVAAAGPEAMTVLWRDPATLPDLGELAEPSAWLARVGLTS